MTLEPNVKLLWYDARGTDGSDLSRVHAVYECAGQYIRCRADESAPEALVRQVAQQSDAPRWEPGIHSDIQPGQAFVLAILS